MSERIVVPDGMLKAAVDARMAIWEHANDGYRNSWMGVSAEASITAQESIALEAALRWQSENPIVPTDEQCDELINMIGANGRSLVRYPSRISKEQARNMLVEWVRRMYLAPEPTVQFFDTAFGRFEIDNRVPPGEIRLYDWNGPVLMKHLRTPEHWAKHECGEQPEPDVPEEIKDLIHTKLPSTPEAVVRLTNAEKIEAYRRGKQSK
jgi:hypothetical protein